MTFLIISIIIISLFFLSLLIFSIRNYFSKVEAIGSYPAISFKEFLTYYNNAPEKWSIQKYCYTWGEDTYHLYYCAEEIYFSSDYEYHKFRKWQEVQERNKKYNEAMEKLKYLKGEWAEDMNKADSYKTELAEAEAAAKYWEDLYNQIVKENKKHD